MIPSPHHFDGSLQLNQYDCGLPWGTQNWTRPRFGLIGSGNTLLTQSRTLLAFFIARAYCWHMSNLVSTRTLSCFPAGQLSVNSGRLGLFSVHESLVTSLLWTSGDSCQSFCPAAYFSSLLRSLNCYRNLLCSTANYLLCPVLFNQSATFWWSSIFFSVWTSEPLKWRTCPAYITCLTKCVIKYAFYFLVLILKLAVALFFPVDLIAMIIKKKCIMKAFIKWTPLTDIDLTKDIYNSECY